jgi:hypothetical protein
MFSTFKLSFVVYIMAFFDLATFWAILQKIGQFFSNLLVTLHQSPTYAPKIDEYS